MIGRILKLEPEAPPPPSSKRPDFRRWVILGMGLAALFAGVVMAMLVALPRPHSQGDYLIAGGVATLVTMLALFGALLSTTLRIHDPFYKKRRR